jgi:hypothetical protein
MIVTSSKCTLVGLPNRLPDHQWPNAGPAASLRMGAVHWRAVLATLAFVAVTSGSPHRALADLQVRMPTVDYREVEFEHNGLFTFDKDRSLGGQQSYTNAIGYGLTPWWEIELEGESNSVPDSSVHYTATTVENTFQLTQPGQYSFNFGFFAEYSQSALRNEPNSFAVGPIIQKELHNVLGIDSVHTFNVFVTHDVGHNASHATGLELAWQSRLYLTPYIDPAIEYYGFIDDLANAGPFSKQQHFLGPVAVGAVNFAPYGKVKYEVGYLFGLTPASPRGATRWKLEYEIAF